MSLWGSCQDELIRRLYRCRWDVAFPLRFVLLTCCIDKEGGGISEALGKWGRKEYSICCCKHFEWMWCLAPFFGNWHSASDTIAAPLQNSWSWRKFIFPTEMGGGGNWLVELVITFEEQGAQLPLWCGCNTSPNSALVPWQFPKCMGERSLFLHWKGQEVEKYVYYFWPNCIQSHTNQ